MEVHEVTLPVTGTPEGAARARRTVMDEVSGWRRARSPANCTERRPWRASSWPTPSCTAAPGPHRSLSFFDVATVRVTVREAQRARPPGC